MDDAVEQVFMDALRDLDWPVSQPPGLAENETYLTFNAIAGDERTASNEPTRIRHMVQLHAWSRSDEGEHRTAFFAAADALRRAGVKIWSWGPDTYEQDTGIHHIACTCVWWQKD